MPLPPAPGQTPAPGAPAGPVESGHPIARRVATPPHTAYAQRENA